MLFLAGAWCARGKELLLRGTSIDVRGLIALIVCVARFGESLWGQAFQEFMASFPLATRLLSSMFLNIDLVNSWGMPQSSQPALSTAHNQLLC